MLVSLWGDWALDMPGGCLCLEALRAADGGGKCECEG